MTVQNDKKNNLSKMLKIWIFTNEKFKNIDFDGMSIFNNKKEICDFIDSAKTHILFYIYKYKNNIEDILYYSEECLEIKNEMLNGINDYFYLDKLISENKEIINYIYEISLIRDKNNDNKKVKDNSFSKLIISKIILDLVDNYEQTTFFHESEINELEEIKRCNIDIIEKNIDIFKELSSNFNEDYIRKTSIDEIYIDIIILFIETKKFCDENYIQGIIKQLDLENIFLTKIMVVKLSNTLNSNEKIKNDYKIEKFDDLFNDFKINFYYVLFKYILKNTFLKYQIDFLIEMTKQTRNLIKYNSEPFDGEKIGKIKEKFSVFIKSMTDSEYYLDLLYSKNNNKDNNKNNNKDNSNDSTTCLNSNEQIFIKQKEK